MKFLKLALNLLLFLSGRNFLHAQFTNVLIDNAGDPEETSIIINPTNTQNILAGANINFAYRSDDGGLTWTKQDLESSYGVWGDPCLIADTAGDFFFIHLSNPSSGNWIDRIVIQKSTDAGLNWNDGSYTGLNGTRAQDKAWAVVNQNTNEIYMAWTQFDSYGSTNANDSSIILFSKSTDGGGTWSIPLRINRKAGDCLDSDNTTEGAVPAVGPNGEIYVCWSFDDTLFFDRSTDDGSTWLTNDIAVSAQPGGWDYAVPGLYRCNGLPVTKCDLSGGPHNGTIYVNWTDQRNGTDNTDVFLSKSADGGNTWSAPVKVNDDVNAAQQFFTWMDVDQQTGNLYFIFYDRRNYTDTHTDVYAAFSVDGGSTFVNQKISESAFDMSGSVFFGDYTNISAYEGKILPIWTRQDSGTTSVYTALLDFPTLIEVAPLTMTKQEILFQNFPNPVSDQTTIEMQTPEKGYYTLELFDLAGKKVASLLQNNFFEEGTHSILFNLNDYHLLSGTYYYSLSGEKMQLTRQLIILH